MPRHEQLVKGVRSTRCSTYICCIRKLYYRVIELGVQNGRLGIGAELCQNFLLPAFLIRFVLSSSLTSA